jgi:hypothetical protein
MILGKHGWIVLPVVLIWLTACNSPLRQDFVLPPSPDKSFDGNPFEGPDRDGDGLTDEFEVVWGSSPDNADTDGDGLSDYAEYILMTDPNLKDTDEDSLSDGNEVDVYSTDPAKADTDGDGINDGDEINIHHTNPNSRDSDGDGLSDGDEINTYHTDPLNPDSDGDGFPDGGEINSGSDPLNNASKPVDEDNNGLPDAWEKTYPTIGGGEQDFDKDGLTNREEWIYGTDPTNADTDKDGQKDGDEVRKGTDPRDPKSLPPEESGSRAITEFFITSPVIAQGIINGNEIIVEAPHGTDLTAMTATVIHSGTSVSPASGEAHDFNSPVTYRITASNGTSKTYTVTVNVAPANAKTIRSFNVSSPTNMGGLINEGDHTILLNVPYGTDLTAITPVITHSGVSITPASGVAQDFSHPLTYTVTAADETTQDYTVTVNMGLPTAKEITGFSVTSPVTAEGIIAGTVITLNVPHGTNISAMVPVITHSGASLTPPSETIQDFRNSLRYTVTAGDGSAQTYTVTVVESGADSKDIQEFKILSPVKAVGVISGTDITIQVPAGSPRNALYAGVTHTGVSLSPPQGLSQNFENPVTYTVRAANGSTQAYTVTVVESGSDSKDIQEFKILSPVQAAGVISGTDINVTVPAGTPRTAMITSITHTGAAVTPSSGTTWDLSSPVTCTVTAGDSSTQTYTITVTEQPSGAKNIEEFRIVSPVTAAGGITGNAVTVNAPIGAAREAMVPEIVVSPGASISPASGIPQNFNNPVYYTVTAADGTAKTYTVTVNIALADSKNISAFSVFDDATQTRYNGSISGTSINITVPYGTALAGMVTDITHTGASISPASGTPQNFTYPVYYTVTAVDTTTKFYAVTVQWGPEDFKDIESFTVRDAAQNEYVGTITGTDIQITVPHGTPRNALFTQIEHTGASISPITGRTQDFTNPVHYLVTAKDTSTKSYTVTVTEAPEPPEEDEQEPPAP